MTDLIIPQKKLKFRESLEAVRQSGNHMGICGAKSNLSGGPSNFSKKMVASETGAGGERSPTKKRQ